MVELTSSFLRRVADNQGARLAKRWSATDGPVVVAGTRTPRRRPPWCATGKQDGNGGKSGRIDRKRSATATM
jgi:hypothetical protein